MKEKLCPLTADSCMQHDCEFYMPVVGKNPNTGETMRPHECAFKLVPVFLMGVISAATKIDGEISAARKDLRTTATNLNSFFQHLNDRLPDADTPERDRSQVHISKG